MSTPGPAAIAGNATSVTAKGRIFGMTVLTPWVGQVAAPTGCEPGGVCPRAHARPKPPVAMNDAVVA